MVSPKKVSWYLSSLTSFYSRKGSITSRQWYRRTRIYYISKKNANEQMKTKSF